MADRKEIRKRIAEIIYSLTDGEEFTVYQITYKYFSFKTHDEWVKKEKKEWDRVMVYSSEIIRSMREKGLIEAEEQETEGKRLPKKVYKATPQAKDFAHRIVEMRGEEVE